MNDNENTSVVSIGFTGLLTLIFIVLKLCGVIAWSWLWVLAPLWIPLAIGPIIISLIFLGAWISELHKKKK